MTAHLKTTDLLHRLHMAGIDANYEQAETLRRAELTLQRWAEKECGDENDYSSWAIERDETTGKPFMCIYPHKGNSRKYAIPDREAGALRRVKRICADLAIHFFHQTDPRGCALYVSKEPLPDNAYHRGIACCN